MIPQKLQHKSPSKKEVKSSPKDKTVPSASSKNPSPIPTAPFENILSRSTAPPTLAVAIHSILTDPQKQALTNPAIPNIQIVKRETSLVLKNINNREKQYDTIYLFLSEPKLLVYSLKENKYDELLLIGVIDRFVEKAVELAKIERKKK